MTLASRLLRAVLGGALSGAVFLGVGGRLTMRCVALLAGRPPGFSIGGSLEVVAAGALYGAACGLVSPLVPRSVHRVRPLLIAGGLVVLVAATSDAARSATLSLPAEARYPAIALFVPVVLAYGYFTEWLLRGAASLSTREIATGLKGTWS